MKLARTASLWTIHDTDANRLIQIVLAERPERAAAMLAELLVGMHWAARGE